MKLLSASSSSWAKLSYEGKTDKSLTMTYSNLPRYNPEGQKNFVAIWETADGQIPDIPPIKKTKITGNLPYGMVKLDDLTFRPGYQYIVGYSLLALDQKNTSAYNASVYIPDISKPDDNEEAVTTIQVTKVHTYGKGINLKFKCLPGFDPSLFSCWVGVWNSEVNFRAHPCIAGMRIPGYESSGQLSLNVALEAEKEYRAVLFMDGWNDSMEKCSSQNAAAYDVFSAVNVSKEG